MPKYCQILGLYYCANIGFKFHEAVTAMMAKEFFLLFSSLFLRLNFTHAGTNERVLFRSSSSTIQSRTINRLVKVFNRERSGWWVGLLRAGVMSFGGGMILGYIWGCI